MTFTSFLKNLSSKDTLIAGGKGASLGEMIQSGIPVPGGFVVLSTTFDYFVEKTGLGVQIQGILDKVDHKTISSVEEASESIQALIMSFPMPEEVESEIYTSYDAEKLEYVAVRSSATAEDGAEHAWAGQLDSFLNTTRDTLIEKVRRCWASLFTPRAIFYRFEKELHKDHISVAVVAQKMVQSEVSGIAFSVHPVTQDRNQMIIEAGYGLGEAIVSGSVTPDSYVVRKDNSEIDITVNHQQKALYRAEAGGNEWVQLGDKGKDQILAQEQIQELAKIILRIENHYGFPCDIEWAYEDGVFYIVQSRPITTITQDSRERFEKTYTRDTTLIIQQAWNDVFIDGFVTEGIHNPYEAPVIHYMRGGTIEIWENETCTHYYLDELLKKHSESDVFYRKMIDKYLQVLATCEQRRKEKYTTDIHFLKNHVQMIFDEMKGFVTFYFAGGDERVPEKIREDALKIRETDSFFASNDKYIRESLIQIYPHLQGYESCILWQEIDNPPSIEELKKRRESYLVQGTKYNAHMTIEEYASQHPNYYFHIEQVTTKDNVLQGQTGYMGRVRGKVFVLLRNDQVQDVQEGDIIVSPMTTPEHVPAMQKAAAFITDEGGITCHAAIVARELKKPCVIGTKFATQLLKDGDDVEVDADNGVVRILSNRKDGIGNDLYNIESDIWSLKSTEAYMHLCYPWIQAFEQYPIKKPRKDHYTTLTCVIDNVVYNYENFSIFEDIRNDFLKKAFADSSYYADFKSTYQNLVNSFEIEIELLNKTSFGDLSNENLINLYNHFFIIYQQEFAHILLISEAITQTSSLYIDPHFKAIMGEGFESDFHTLTEPTQPSFLEEERKARRTLLEEYKTAGKFDEDKLQKHADEYFYIKSNYKYGLVNYNSKCTT